LAQDVGVGGSRLDALSTNLFFSQIIESELSDCH
jgi:hypothetical protein